MRTRASAAQALTTAAITFRGYMREHIAKGSTEAKILRNRDMALMCSEGLSSLPRSVTFQQRVDPWMTSTFSEEVCNDELERCDRLLEETLELLQTRNYPVERVQAIETYVYGRPVGETYQEVGGVMVCLAAFCRVQGIDMHEAGETELERVWKMTDVIREKQKTKPRGSALPQATGEMAQRVYHLRFALTRLVDMFDRRDASQVKKEEVISDVWMAFIDFCRNLPAAVGEFAIFDPVKVEGERSERIQELLESNVRFERRARYAENRVLELEAIIIEKGIG